MKPTDFVKAIGVALLTLILTLAASFPMVAFYAYVIEPGHEQQFYVDAAQWIAPWSSHLLGPLVLFGCNFWLAKGARQRKAVLFSVTSVVCYAVIDFGTLPAMGADIRTAFTPSVVLSLGVNLVGAVLGAHLGVKKRAAMEGAAA